MPPFGRKKISRRKPGDTRAPKNYFDMKTQEAIVEFQDAQDFPTKHEIYLNRIHPAFKTLVDNLIHVYGYHVMHDTSEDLRNECVEFLFGVLGKFNAQKGSKAFSYFNVVARNWLTIKSKQNAKNMQMLISIYNKDGFTDHELSIIENYQVVPSIEDVETESFVKKMFDQFDDQEPLTDTEQVVFDAIKELFKSVDDIEIINKRAVLVYIREMTTLNSKQLSLVLTELKRRYKQAKTNILND